jgi:hypothetical protein
MSDRVSLIANCELALMSVGRDAVGGHTAALGAELKFARLGSDWAADRDGARNRRLDETRNYAPFAAGVPTLGPASGESCPSTPGV